MYHGEKAIVILLSRNGELILKTLRPIIRQWEICFSPRNGGRKWYGVPFTHRYVYHGEKANVILYGPAMGK